MRFILTIVLLLTFFMFPAAMFAYSDDNSASLNFGLSLSAVSGARTLVGLRDGITGLENASAEKFSTPLHNGLRMGLRGLSLIALELPIDYVAMTIQHEFFGHGARCVEFGGRPGYVYVAPPWPYGNGYAEMFCGGIPLTGMQNHVLNVGGVTSGDVMREHMAMQWIANQKISAPATWLYNFSAMQTTGYLWFGDLMIRAQKQKTDVGDMSNYVVAINRFYQQENLLSMQLLKNLSLVNFADPLFFYTWYAMYRYVRYGEDTPVWMIPFGHHIKYLPAAKMTFTPFGPDITMHNYLVMFDRAVDVTLRGGILGANTFWGMGILGQAWRYKGLTLGGHVEVWRQPTIKESAQFYYALDSDLTKPPKYSHADSGFGEHQWGFLGTVQASWRFIDSLALDLELGGKSEGYVPGEPIGQSFLLRSGVTLYY